MEHILDDSPIGYLYELGDKSTEPKKLSKAQIIEMIKDSSEYKINNYTISNGG